MNSRYLISGTWHFVIAFIQRNTVLLLCICFACLNLIPLYANAQPSYQSPDPAPAQSTEQLLIQLKQQLQSQQQQIDQLTEQLSQNNIPLTVNDAVNNTGSTLELAGFFDVTAHTTDDSEHTFDLGGLELDLQYNHRENFAVSTALVWDGDVAEVAVAVLDYHVNSHTVPTRGNLFGEPGYHIQFGRFDIPFGIDYEYFAAPDRPNITAPLTTQRIQNDGFNGDGVRAYGSWSMLDYAFYWTNSLFEDSGSSVGTRIGLYPGRDPFSVHKREKQADFSIGYSWLYDMDMNENRRNTLQAFDMSWRYGISELVLEYMQLDNIDTVILPGGGSAGPADEQGYNARIVFDFDPYALFLGYGEWKPEYSDRIDDEDPAISYRVEKLKRVTLGGSYVFDDYLQIKLEYLSHLDTLTEEADFEKRKLTFQMVASF